MKKVLPLLFFLLLVNVSVNAENRPELAISHIPIDLLKNAHTIVRDERLTIDIRSIRDYEMRHYYAVTLLSEKSRAHRYVEHYDKLSKINKLKAKIYDANGELIREVRKGEVHDESAISSFSIYEDDRKKYIDISYKQYPYTIVFECVKNNKSTLVYTPWYIQQPSTAIEEGNYSIKVPKDIQIQHRSKNIDLSPTTTSEGGTTIYHWRVEQLGAKVREVVGPSYQSVLPVVYAVPQRFKYDDFVGSMASWEAYSQSMYELNKDRDILSPAMQAKVKAITAEAATTQEKIDTLYRYLQENMRYVSVQLGIGGWQTFDAQYVEKNKYGDCKALSNFMKAMLKAAGIPAYQALIYSDADKIEYEEDFVSPWFNHVILYVPEEEYWLECTSKNNPPNYLGRNGEDRQVLLIKENGGALMQTPRLGADGNQRISQVEVALTANGQAAIQQTLIAKGNRQDALRYFAGFSDKDRRTYLRRYDFLPNGNLDTLSIKPDPMVPTTTLTYKMELPHYAAKAGRRLFVPLNPFNTFDQGIPADDNRQHPVVVKQHYYEEDAYRITIPEGYELESKPKTVKDLETPFGRYELDVTVQGDQLICTRKLEILPVNLPADQFEELRTFYNQIVKKDKQKLVLVKKKT